MHHLVAPGYLWTDGEVGSQAERFDISYRPYLFMKAQVLADFLVECTKLDDMPGEMPTHPLPSDLTKRQPESSMWMEP